MKLTILLVALIFVACALPLSGGAGPSQIDWKSELKRPEVQKSINEYIVSHCMIVGPLDDKEWQADHGKPRKLAAIVCSGD